MSSWRKRWRRWALTLGETLALVRDLAAGGVGVRTLTGALCLDTRDPQSPDTRRVLAVLELVQELDASYLRERREARRRRAQAEGRRLGCPLAEDSPQVAGRLAQARQMRLEGVPVAAISAELGLNRHTLSGYFGVMASRSTGQEDSGHVDNRFPTPAPTDGVDCRTSHWHASSAPRA